MKKMLLIAGVAAAYFVLRAVTIALVVAGVAGTYTDPSPFLNILLILLYWPSKLLSGLGFYNIASAYPADIINLLGWIIITVVINILVDRGDI